MCSFSTIIVFFTVHNGSDSNTTSTISKCISKLQHNTSHNSHFYVFSFDFLSVILLQGSDTYLASCDQGGEESPRLTSGCQDEGVTNAKREEKSVGGIQSTKFNNQLMIFSQVIVKGSG